MGVFCVYVHGCVTVFWGIDTSPRAYSMCLYNTAQSWLSLSIVLPDAICFGTDFQDCILVNLEIFHIDYHARISVR